MRRRCVIGDHWGRDGLQRDDESGAAILSLTRDRDPPPCAETIALRDCEAQPEAAEAPRDRALPLLEGIEDLADFLRFDADAGVGGPDFNLARAMDWRSRS